MASQYAYTITLFDADRRKQGPKFEGVVSSTLKPLESQVSKASYLLLLLLEINLFRTKSLSPPSTLPGTIRTSLPT